MLCWWPTGRLQPGCEAHRQPPVTAKREGHTLHRKVHRPGAGTTASTGRALQGQTHSGQSLVPASACNSTTTVPSTGWLSTTRQNHLRRQKLLLTENSYPSAGRGYSPGNPGTIPLEIIEVQSGSWAKTTCVRFEDTYGGTSMSVHPKIYVAGHRGMVGSAIDTSVADPSHPGTIASSPRMRAELDLTSRPQSTAFLQPKPDQVPTCFAAKGPVEFTPTTHTR